MGYGQRGIEGLRVQVATLSDDVRRVERNQKEHIEQHAAEIRERTATRRWLVAGVIVPTLVALISAVVTIGVVLAG